MTQAPRAYLGDRLSVEFDGREYRLFYPKDDLPVRGTVFMGHDAIKAFKAFIELIERATLVEHRNIQASVSPEARDDLIAYEAARNAAKAKSQKP